jgi:hypothetical protein
MFKVLLLSVFAISCVIARDIIPIDDLIVPIKDVEVEPANIACTIDIHTQTASPQPVYLRPGTSNPFYPANRQGQIQMTAGQQVNEKIKF